jgi:peroxiredoxin
MTTMPTTMPQEPMDDFSLPLLTGEERRLCDFLTGRRALIVVFWSAVCSHCMRYDAYLNDRFEKDPEVGLVAIAARQGESRESLRKSVRERRLRFLVLHDAERAVARAWQVEQTPRVFLLDAGRHVVYRGAIDNFRYPVDPEHETYLEEAIAAFLAGKEVPRAETPSFGCPVQSVYYDLDKPLPEKR